MPKGIKFRVWDKEQNKFLEINWDAEETRYNQGKAIIRYSTKNGIYATLSGYRDDDGYPYEIDAEILQYTCLKDKNGKEIYKGYIVKHDNFIDEVKFEVYKHPSGDWQAGGMSIWEEISDDGQNPWEIVGNVYENPELLEGIKVVE